MPRLDNYVVPMLTVAQAAFCISMSPDFILAEIARGHLPAHKFGREYRIEREAFDRWKQRRQYRCVA